MQSSCVRCEMGAKGRRLMPLSPRTASCLNGGRGHAWGPVCSHPDLSRQSPSVLLRLVATFGVIAMRKNSLIVGAVLLLCLASSSRAAPVGDAELRAADG